MVSCKQQFLEVLGVFCLFLFGCLLALAQYIPEEFYEELSMQEIPVFNGIETISMISLLGMLLAFFMRAYFNELRDHKECLKGKEKEPEKEVEKEPN